MPSPAAVFKTFRTTVACVAKNRPFLQFRQVLAIFNHLVDVEEVVRPVPVRRPLPILPKELGAAGGGNNKALQAEGEETACVARRTSAGLRSGLLRTA